METDDIKGLDQIEKFIRTMAPEKVLELYELALQQEEDDADCIIDEDFE